MAGTTWGDVATVTKQYILPYITDQIYTSNPTFLKMSQKGLRLAGGKWIEYPVLFAKTPGGSYRGFDTLDVSWVSQLQTATLDWKQYYAAVTIDGLSEIENGGPDAVVTLVSAYMENARRKLEDTLGSDLWGSNTNVKALDGLQAAIDDSTNVTTYAGISRATNTWWKATYLDNGGTQITLPIMQTAYGNCTVGQTAPDLIVCDQTIYNEVWNKVQPQQRFGNGQSPEIGFPYIQFNGAKIMVDAHVASAVGSHSMYFLNTEYMELWVHRLRDFFLTGWMQPTNQDARTMHIYWAGNVGVTAPRYFEQITDLA